MSTIESLAARMSNASVEAYETTRALSYGSMIEREQARQAHTWSRDGYVQTLGKASLEAITGGIVDFGPREGTDAVLNFLNDNAFFPNVSPPTINPDLDQMGRVQVDRETVGQGWTGKLSNRLWNYSQADSGFEASPELIAMYGVDDRGEAFDDATLLKIAASSSQIEMATHRARAMREREVAVRSAGMGVATNLAVSFASSLTDPLAIASGAISGGASGPATSMVLRGSASTIARLAARGVIAGGENIAQGWTLERLAGDDYTSLDAARDFGLGVFFSTAFGLPSEIKEASRRTAIAAQRAQIAEAGATTTPKGEAAFRDVTGHTPTATPIDLDNAARAKIRTQEIDDLPDAVVVRAGDEAVIDGAEGAGKIVASDGRNVEIEYPGGRRAKVDADAVSVERTLDRAPDAPSVVTRGRVDFDRAGRAVVTFTRDANAETFLHEPAHVFRRTFRAVSAENADKLNDLYGQAGDRWSVAAEEKFARQFVENARTGKAPSPELVPIFDQFKAWLRTLYQSLTRQSVAKLSPAHRELFNSIIDDGKGTATFGANRDRIAGEMETAIPNAEQRKATLAVMEAAASVWGRATGKNADDYFSEVLVGVRAAEPAAPKAQTLLQAENVTPPPTGPRVIPIQDNGGAKAAWTNKRWSRTSTLGASDDEGVRRVASMIFDDNLLNEEGVVTRMTAEGAMQMHHGAVTRAVVDSKKYLDAYINQRAPSRIHFLKRMALAEEFWVEVGKAKRLQATGAPIDPNIKGGLDVMNRAYAEAHDLARQNQVPGFDEFDARDDYLNRVTHHPAFYAEIRKPGGAQTVENLFVEGVRRGLADSGLTDVEMVRLAQQHVRAVSQVGRLSGVEMRQIFAGVAPKEKTIAYLIDAGFSRERAIEISDILTPLRNENAGRIPNARRRLMVDESVSVKRADGTTLRFDDLLENNALRLFERYSRSVTAQSAMQSVYREATTIFGKNAPITTDGELMDAMQRAMLDAGESASQINTRMNHLRTGLLKIRGLPIEDNNFFNENLWRIRQFNSMAGNGAFAISAGFEVGHATVRVGLRPMLASIPQVWEIGKQIRDGNLTSPMGRLLYDTLAIGSDTLTNRTLMEFGVHEQPFATGAEQAANKFDHYLLRARTAITNLTFLPQLTAWSRQVVALSKVQSIADQAWTGKPPSAKRMRWLGMDKARWDAVADQLRKNANRERGRVTDLQLDNWTDVQAKADFLNAITTNTNAVIQEGSIGGSNPWLDKEVGKTIFQFRQFALNAWEKQLLSPIQIGDRETIVTMATAPVFGLLQYYAMVQINTLGMDEERRRDYVARALTPDRMAIAAFSRASFASIVPTLYDTFASRLGYETLGGVRTTGLESDPIFGNYTFNVLTRGLTGLLSPIRAGIDPNYKFSRDDARSMRIMTPLGRHPAVGWLYNEMTKGLPNKSLQRADEFLGNVGVQ